MKVLIVSDTHRRDETFLAVHEREKPYDVLIHAGDAEGSEDYFEALADCECHFVSGNNDFFSELPYEDLFFLGPYRVFLTHGHHYHVSSSESVLAEEARQRDADICIYGHTHRPAAHYEGSLLILNPGSLGYPRQEGHLPSYLVLYIEKDGTLRTDLRFLGGAD